MPENRLFSSRLYTLSFICPPFLRSRLRKGEEYSRSLPCFFFFDFSGRSHNTGNILSLALCLSAEANLRSLQVSRILGVKAPYAPRSQALRRYPPRLRLFDSSLRRNSRRRKRRGISSLISLPDFTSTSHFTERGVSVEAYVFNAANRFETVSFTSAKAARAPPKLYDLGSRRSCGWRFPMVSEATIFRVSDHDNMSQVADISRRTWLPKVLPCDPRKALADEIAYLDYLHRVKSPVRSAHRVSIYLGIAEGRTSSDTYFL